LVAHGVTRVGMEATGVYWKPVFWVLEDAVGPSAGKSPPAKTAPLSSHHQSPPDPAKPHVRAPPRPLARLSGRPRKFVDARGGCAEGVRGDARSVDMELGGGFARFARIHHSGPTIG